MSLFSLRSIVLGCAVAPLVFSSALAAEATPSAPGAETPASGAAALSAPGAGMAPCPNCPPMINQNGGTAIINFVAPVTQKTMAELAKTAQNSVIGGADRIRINISSQGGTVHAMQFAVNVLKNLSVPVETVAMSQIASAAVALYCAGEDRYMADGAALYLHQQRGVHEIQDKTAAAIVREYQLSNRWYDGLLHACTGNDADRSLLDYSARDVVIDREQAMALGMVTAPMEDLRGARTWGAAMNVVAPDVPRGRAYPVYR